VIHWFNRRRRLNRFQARDLANPWCPSSTRDTTPFGASKPDGY
jgi:hypothetical protein